MYKQIAKNIQELLNAASIPAGKNNALALMNIHTFLDHIQSGALQVQPVKQVAQESAAS
jgi:hypothetical protein